MTKLVRLRVSAATTACAPSSASASRADASKQRAMRLLVAEMYVTELKPRDVKWQLQNRPDAPEVLKRRLVTRPWRPRTRCTRGTLRQIGGRLCTSPSG